MRFEEQGRLTAKRGDLMLEEGNSKPNFVCAVEAGKSNSILQERMQHSETEQGNNCPALSKLYE